MRRALFLALALLAYGIRVASAQTPGILYTFPGNPASFAGWNLAEARYNNDPVTWASASMSGAGGNLVVTETGNGSGIGNAGGLVGGRWYLVDPWNYPMESALYSPGSPYEKGNLDVTGLDYIEADIHNNLPAGQTAMADLYLDVTETEDVVVFNTTSFAVGQGLTTLRFPLSLLTPRQRTNVKGIAIGVQSHTALGNLTWTISEVRSVGTPLAYRDIVTNNAGSPDDGIDGAFPLNTSDMLAIVGNGGAESQLGLSRNPAGSGSLQWTDKGGTGAIGSESGATIGWGEGSGWRAAQPGDATDGKGYYERLADFSNYDRMTVRISAADAITPSGSVGIEGVFAASDPNGDSAAPPIPATILASQNLPTDGQYHELVYDLSSVTFLKNVWHWGLDVAPHPNNIVFNIDNIRLWNSTVPAGVAGDYNGNGAVDAADYVLWRNGGTLQNEGATPGSNTPEDYTYWRSRFGATSGSGAALATTVPEPNVLVLMILGVFASWGIRRGRPNQWVLPVH